MIIITWKSGSGKSTLSSHLEEKYWYSIPFKVTTRGMRDWEDLSEYRFVSKEYFKFLKENQLLLEDTTFNWGQYWTTWVYTENTVFVVDDIGRDNILKVFPMAKTVWIEVSELERRKRLFNRGLRGDSLEERMDGGSEQMSPLESCLRVDGTKDVDLIAKQILWV